MSRTSKAMGLVAAMSIAGLVVAGCTDSSAGVPRPQDASTSESGEHSETSAPETSGTGSRPIRPAELKLDGKDPCALIPQADHAKFYIERPGLLGHSEAYKSPDCLYSTDVAGFSLTLVVTEGIEKWTDGSKSAKAKEIAPVAGFPAISATLPAEKNGCDVAVDVAEGQYLLATVIIDTSKLSQMPERCEYARQLAESAMSALVAS